MRNIARVFAFMLLVSVAFVGCGSDGGGGSGDDSSLNSGDNGGNGGGSNSGTNSGSNSGMNSGTNSGNNSGTVTVTLEPGHGQVGTEVTLESPLVTPENYGRLVVVFDGIEIAANTYDEGKVTFFVPWVEPGPVDVAVGLVDEDTKETVVRGSSTFTVDAPEEPGEYPGAILDEAIRNLGTIRQDVYDWVELLIDEGVLSVSEADEVRTDLATIEDTLSRWNEYYPLELTDEELTAIDVMLVNSGVADMLGIAAVSTKAAKPDCNEHALACALATADFTDFLLSVVSGVTDKLLIATAVASFFTAGTVGVAAVPMIKISFDIKLIASIIEAFVPSDIEQMHVSLVPEGGAKVEVGKAARLVVKGDFMTESDYVSVGANYVVDKLTAVEFKQISTSNIGNVSGPVLITKNQEMVKDTLKEKILDTYNKFRLNIVSKALSKWLDERKIRVHDVVMDPRLYAPSEYISTMTQRASEALSLGVDAIFALLRKAGVDIDQGYEPVTLSATSVAQFDAENLKIRCEQEGTTTVNIRAHRFTSGDHTPWWVSLAIGCHWPKEVTAATELECVAEEQCPIANLRITDPYDGYRDDTRVFSFSGEVDDASGIVHEVTLRIRSASGGSTLEQKVKVENGQFHIDNVVLSAGRNEIVAVVDATDPSTGTACHLESEPITVIAAIPPASILVTLTWDEDDTDVDLYLYEPEGAGGEVCYYQHTNTALGGELDTDDVDGYGPENYSLSEDQGDTIAEGEYRVRLHYYEDHTGANTTAHWHLRIVINENKSDEVIREYSGALSQANRDNDDPQGSGADWTDVIATISCTKDASGNTECAIQ